MFNGKRLTDKKYDVALDCCVETQKDIYFKLKCLENEEDECGCELLTLIKASENGFYIRRDGKNIKFSVSDCDSVLVDFHDKTISCFNEGKFLLSFNTKDYGKIWALTEEELQ